MKKKCATIDTMPKGKRKPATAAAPYMVPLAASAKPRKLPETPQTNLYAGVDGAQTTGAGLALMTESGEVLGVIPFSYKNSSRTWLVAWLHALMLDQQFDKLVITSEKPPNRWYNLVTSISRSVGGLEEMLLLSLEMQAKPRKTRIYRVLPREWRRDLLGHVSKGYDKQISLDAAKSKFGYVTSDDNMAEAVLLAAYGRLQEQRGAAK